MITVIDNVYKRGAHEGEAITVWMERRREALRESQGRVPRHKHGARADRQR